jgi:hypothetical protein
MFSVEESVLSGDGVKIIKRTVLPDRHSDRQDAIAAVEAESSRYPTHGYDVEHDYWWGRDGNELHRFVISGQPESPEPGAGGYGAGGYGAGPYGADAYGRPHADTSSFDVAARIGAEQQKKAAANVATQSAAEQAVSLQGVEAKVNPAPEQAGTAPREVQPLNVRWPCRSAATGLAKQDGISSAPA